MLDEPEDHRLDQSLRDTFSEFDLPPAGHVWAGIEQRLADLPPPVLPVRKRRPVPVPFLLVLVALLAGLGGWLLPRPATKAGRVAIADGEVKSTVRLNAAAAADAATAKPERVAKAWVWGAGAPKVPGHAAVSKDNEPKPAANARKVPQATANRLARTAEMLTAPTRAAAHPTVVLAAVTESDGPGTNALIREVREGKGPAGMAGQLLAMPVAPSADSVPAVLRPLVALTRRAEAAPSVALLAEAARTRQIAHLRAQRAELLRLRVHTDSLLLVLGDVPVVVPATVAAAPAGEVPAAADTTKPAPLARRWSLQLAAAPEQNALTLEGPENDELTRLRRGFETGRAGLNAHLLAEYRLSQRLSLGAGLGYSAFGAELRINNRRTEVDVDYRTTSTTTATAFTSTNQSYSVRLTQVPMLNPVFNNSGQVLGYDTVYSTRQDTLFTTTILHDTVRTTVHTTTPILTRREVSTSTTLRPHYRFATLPVLLRYRLTPPGASRFWTDVALGGQVQVFLGGTQAVTDDGVNFRTETIAAGAGPFRALNLTLSGSLALNYALTDRLSVSAAPSLRWQALSLYKAETGLRQQPTATGLLLGVRWQL